MGSFFMAPILKAGAAGGKIVTAPARSFTERLALLGRRPNIPAMERLFTRIASYIAALAGQPIAFIAALGFILVWAVTGPIFRYSDTWQLVVNTATTIVTFLMVFLIQNSQNRDGAAMQAKLDELMRAVEGARNQFIGIEHQTDKEIEDIRENLEEECAEGEGGQRSIENLTKRF